MNSLPLYKFCVRKCRGIVKKVIGCVSWNVKSEFQNVFQDNIANLCHLYDGDFIPPHNIRFGSVDVEISQSKVVRFVSGWGDHDESAPVEHHNVEIDFKFDGSSNAPNNFRFDKANKKLDLHCTKTIGGGTSIWVVEIVATCPQHRSIFIHKKVEESKRHAIWSMISHTCSMVDFFSAFLSVNTGWTLWESERCRFDRVRSDSTNRWLWQVSSHFNYNPRRPIRFLIDNMTKCRFTFQRFSLVPVIITSTIETSYNVVSPLRYDILKMPSWNEEIHFE
jgi:hypothetical protein